MSPKSRGHFAHAQNSLYQAIVSWHGLVARLRHELPTTHPRMPPEWGVAFQVATLASVHFGECRLYSLILNHL